MTTPSQKVTTAMLRQLNEAITSERILSTQKPIASVGYATSAGLNFASQDQLAETPENICKVQDALKHLSSDTPRGDGKLLNDGMSGFRTDHWLLAIWALRSLNWQCGLQIAHDWSITSSRFTPNGLEDAWNSYDNTRANPIRIGSLFRLAKHHGWQDTSCTTITAANDDRYKLLGTADIRALAHQEWRIKGVLPAKGLAAIFGESGSGKSFLTLDIAAAIAKGNCWFGNRCHPAPVSYVMLEGEGGLRNRVTALEDAKGVLPDTFKAAVQPFQLTTDVDVYDLAAVVPHGGVIFIDTLNRAAPTSDENSSREMGQILQGAKLLQALTDSLVVVIHHTGKDASRGMRGHSSLHAALDAAIEVTKSGNGRAWVLRKAKEGEEGTPVAFKLDRHVLGTDDDGDEISSCTVSPDNSAVFAKPEPSGGKQKAALKTIRLQLLSMQAYASASAGVTTHPNMKVEDAIKLVAGSLTTTEQKKRTNEARRLVTALVAGGFLMSKTDQTGESWCWLS